MISIILPVYNGEEYLEKCILSIRKQTFQAWELIIIDNGSADKSYDLCREQAKKDERIKVFHQYQNKGVSAARNLGIERASGEFLTFIDADDWIEPDYLEQMLKEQEKEDADMVVCGFQRITEENEGFKDRQKECSGKLYSREEYFANYLLKGNTHCWGVLYRTRKIEGIQFPSKITIGEDLLYLIQAAKQMEKIQVTDYSGYCYYINPKGAMLKKFTPEYMDQLICWEKAKEELVGMYPGLNQKVDSILVVSALLIVGKISQLSVEEQSKYQEELTKCSCIIKEYGSKSSVRRLLPKGYPLKVFVFRIAPSLYLKLYGAKKSVEKAEK